jgi:hypothetical protein
VGVYIDNRSVRQGHGPMSGWAGHELHPVRLRRPPGWMRTLMPMTGR